MKLENIYPILVEIALLFSNTIWHYIINLKVFVSHHQQIPIFSSSYMSLGSTCEFEAALDGILSNPVDSNEEFGKNKHVQKSYLYVPQSNTVVFYSGQKRSNRTQPVELQKHHP